MNPAVTAVVSELDKYLPVEKLSDTVLWSLVVAIDTDSSGTLNLADLKF